MKRSLYYFLTVILFSCQSVIAQNNAQANKIISDLLTEAKTHAVKTNFKLIINNKYNSQSNTSTGSFLLKGNKFVLEMDEMKVWFDGKTQWAYVTQNKEVNITEPTEKELSETNPMAILSAYKSRCNIFFGKTKSATYYNIEMTPKVKSNDLIKIEVQVNKSNTNLVSIKQINRDGVTSLLTLSNFQKGVAVSDNIFTFNPSKFKGAVMNDLR